MTNDDDEKCLVDAIKKGSDLVVIGHSGHRLRLFYEAFPFMVSSVFAAAFSPTKRLLVTCPRRLQSLLCGVPRTARLALFVNTDLCPFAAVVSALRMRVSARPVSVWLRQLHHDDPMILDVLQSLEKGNAPSMSSMRSCYAGPVASTYLIPSHTTDSFRASRTKNASDAFLCAARMKLSGRRCVRTFPTMWSTATVEHKWTGTLIVEHLCTTQWASGYGDDNIHLCRLRSALMAETKGRVAVLDVTDPRECTQRAALSLAVPHAQGEGCGGDDVATAAAHHTLTRVLQRAEILGWKLVAHTETVMPCELPNQALHLWPGARVAFADGRSGTVIDFVSVSSNSSLHDSNFALTEMAGNTSKEWPFVLPDGAEVPIPVTPSTTLHAPSGLYFTKLPLRYGDTASAEELFLAPRSALAGQYYTLRPSLFIGQLRFLRCALASLPSLHNVTLTDLPRWEWVFGAEK